MTQSAIELDSEASFRLRSAGTAWWTLVSVSLAADFLMFPAVSLARGPVSPPAVVLVLGMLGCTLAQGSLLAAWLAWGDAPFPRRFLWHWIIAGGLCCSWLLGVALAEPPIGFREFGFTIALTVPIVSLGAQLPLWIARMFFGWRLVRDAELLAAEQPLSIRDLLLATLLVGASFAVARLSPAAQTEPEFRFAWGLFMTIAAIFSLLAILPAAAILLRPRPFERAVQYSLAYACWPVALLWGSVVVVRIFGLASLAPWPIYGGMTCLVFCYAGTSILAAAVARQHGYRLVWGRTQSRTIDRAPTSNVLMD